MTPSIDTTIFGNISIDHGPPGLLGRALLKAEAAARARGVTLAFASMQDFMRVNEANRDTWGPTFPGFDPAYNDLTRENSFCLLGRNARGEVVATQAGRLYDLTDTSYDEQARSLALIYRDPEAQRLPDERCEVTALAAKGIDGLVFYSGGAWYRPDFRGIGLVEILPRMARALACARWNARCTVTTMVEHNVRKGVYPRNGYHNLEWDVRFIGSRIGTIRFALLWTKRDEMLEDLEWFLSDFDEGVGHSKRAANA
jgi:hypothetical protein